MITIPFFIGVALLALLIYLKKKLDPYNTAFDLNGTLSSQWSGVQFSPIKKSNYHRFIIAYGVK